MSVHNLRFPLTMYASLPRAFPFLSRAPWSSNCSRFGVGFSIPIREAVSHPVCGRSAGEVGGTGKPVRNLGNPSAFVQQAQGWARDIVNADVRGPGDLDNAMRRVEQRYGIPYAALWAPRYRPPKDVGVSIYTKLQAAHADVCERQMRKFKDELDRTKAKSWLGQALVRAAVVVAGDED